MERLRAWRAFATARRHRHLLLIDLPQEAGRDLAGSILTASPGDARLWLGDAPPAGIAHLRPKAFAALLGREWDLLVLDAHPGLDPDAFAAAVGAVRAGGLLILSAPLSSRWGDGASPFLARLARLLRDAPGVLRLGPGQALPAAPPPPPAVPPEWPTADQKRALEALARLARGRPHRPLVLIADRGRGKTTAFGLAAARLLAAGRRVVLTAPRLAAVEPALAHAAAGLPGARRARGRISVGAGGLEYVPPDALALAPRRADLLLVDEAAALPAPLLERLLRTHPRVAFATTVQGYEGSGRGFEVRFQRRLERIAPGWRRIELRTPVRWGPGDPLEALAQRLFLWGESVPAPPDIPSPLVQRIDPQVLAADEEALGRLFRLLVLAHYQTRPRDLLDLLDAPEVRLFRLGPAEAPAALALIREEGGLDPALARAVTLGRRRLRGHLLPQTLAQHLGLAEAPGTRGWRVSRILVHPALQGRGLGSRLLQAVTEAGRTAGMDWIGAAFGATRPLLGFWRRNGFSAVRCGLHRDRASGEHSVVLVRPLSATGTGLSGTARERFCRHFPLQLADPLRDLDSALAADLLHGCPCAGALDSRDLADLAAVARGHRLPEATPAGLQTLAAGLLCDPPHWLDQEARALLVSHLFQHQSWKRTADRLGLSGRRAAVALLRRVVAEALASAAFPAPADG